MLHAADLIIEMQYPSSEIVTSSNEHPITLFLIEYTFTSSCSAIARSSRRIGTGELAQVASSKNAYLFKIKLKCHPLVLSPGPTFHEEKQSGKQVEYLGLACTFAIV